ncbi:MAG: LysR family transcriptional regulator, partial [Eubacteriaceae bacterium]
ELETFLQAAKLNSFSKAAAATGYSQAAVTIQIKNLETELGVKLFDRLGKKTILTYQGSQFYDYAADIMRTLAEARDVLTDPRELTGKLCIGTIESICASVFPSILTEFHIRYPKVTLSIATDSPNKLLEDMNNNTIDIVCLLDQPLNNTKWIKVLEKPEDIVFVASVKNPLTGQKDLTLDRILEEPFILTEKDASYRYLLDQYLASYGKSIEPFLEIGNTDFIISLLKKNMGVSFLPRFCVNTGIEAGELTLLPLDDVRLNICRQVFYHKDKWVTREMAAFLYLIRNTDADRSVTG